MIKIIIISQAYWKNQGHREVPRCSRCSSGVFDRGDIRASQVRAPAQGYCVEDAEAAKRRTG